MHLAFAPADCTDVQLHSKAFITIENLTGMLRSEGIDYGGYRGWGYAGIFRMSVVA
jgi:hypothetical protein